MSRALGLVSGQEAGYVGVRCCSTDRLLLLKSMSQWVGSEYSWVHGTLTGDCQVGDGLRSTTECEGDRQLFVEESLSNKNLEVFVLSVSRRFER